MKRTAATICLAAALVLSFQAPAQAGHGHAIRTAPSPSSGEPVTGGGTWIVNRADAYYIGRLLPGSTFINEVTNGNDWHYGRAFGNVNMCGWVLPGSMGAYLGDAPDSCSSEVMRRLSHRRYIGRDFNAPAHAATDGSAVSSWAGCGMYYNYFYGSDFSSNFGRAADYAGPISSSVRYRFTTRDGNGVVMRDPVLGWGFTYIGCVQRPAALYNDDD